MKKLIRFGVSLDRGLLAEFDRLIGRLGYTSRSKGIADLVRAKLVESEWMEGREIVGNIGVLYDHRQRGLSSRLTRLQHGFHRAIISTQHIHLDRGNCFEVIVVKGLSGEVKRLADLISATRGVKHVALSMSSTGKRLE